MAKQSFKFFTPRDKPKKRPKKHKNLYQNLRKITTKIKNIKAKVGVDNILKYPTL
jgi:hypothetical protein